MEAKEMSQSLSETALINPNLLRIDASKKLGEGGFGVVYRGKYRGLEAAIKQLKVQEFSLKVQQEFYSEAQLMSQLRDPSVVHLYGITQNPYQMVMEFCWLGSLTNYLQNPNIEISWAVRFHLGTGIASGLHYLHTLNPLIIHGDLKSLNVLLVGDRECPNPKLADFGLSRLKTESQSKSKISGGVGQGLTVHWAAPELFSLKPKTTASDIYAFAMTLWEIASRTYPYEGFDQDIIRSAVKEGTRAEIPEGTPESFSNIIQVCWNQDPKKRPSAEQVLQALMGGAEKEVGVLNDEVGLTQSLADISLKSGFVNSLGFGMASQGMEKGNIHTSPAKLPVAPYQTGFVNSLNTPLEKIQEKGAFTDLHASSRQTTAQYKSFFQPEPKIVSASEQVERMSKAAKEQNNIRQKKVEALLKGVTEGHLVEVEQLLKKNPSVGLCMGTVSDLSERTFKGITALQYAAWSLDEEMCDLLMRYLGEHNSTIQLKALYDESDRYSPHGDHYDIKPLMEKTNIYIDTYRQWNDDQKKQYWQKEVGAEQRKCPAWLIYAWSEEGSDVAWTKQDFSRKIKREYEKHRLDWWFTENYNYGRGVGSSWAVYRGRLAGSQMSSLPGLPGLPLIRKGEYWIVELAWDYRDQYILEKRGGEFLVKLKSLSENLKPVEITTIDEKAVKLAKPQSPSEKGTFSPSPSLSQASLNVSQQKKQNELVKACLKGKVDLVKQLESQGGSLLYPNAEGLYPLVAAVYGCSLEMVRYVESQLKEEEAVKQWGEVNAEEACKRLEKNTPTQLGERATYGDVANWYVKHQGSSWCAYYDAACLKHLGYSCWGGWDERYKECVWDVKTDGWKYGGSRERWCSWEGGNGIIRQSVEKRNTMGGAKKMRMILDAGAKVDGIVIKEIREQLEALKNDVVTKVKRSAPVDEKAVKLAKPQSPSEKGTFTFFNATPSPSPSLSQASLNVSQQKKQNELVDACLKGNVDLVKQLESQGASLWYPNGEGLYPLVAAVYGCSLETVRYVESKLKEEAVKQWGEVDAKEACKRLEKNTPTPLGEGATYGDVANWYVKHQGSSWCAYYDATCLKHLGYSSWGGWDGDYKDVKWVSKKELWEKGGSRTRWCEYWDRTEIGGRQHRRYRYGGILDAGARVDGIVIKEIREQLEALKQDVLTKVKRSAPVDEKAVKLAKPQSPPKPGFLTNFFNPAPSPSPSQAGLNASHQKKQNELVEACLKGNVDLVKQLESQGVSLLYPNAEGLYPLVAAVYGCSLEMVRYVESKLKEEAVKQWGEVDVKEACKRLEKNTPTLLGEGATYGDVANWYVKHQGSSWCAYYDAACLKHLEYSSWGGWEGSYKDVKWVRNKDLWGKGGSREAWCRGVKTICRQESDSLGGFGLDPNEGLCDAGARIDGIVIKEIREQLDALKKEVLTKAKRSSSVVGQSRKT